MATTTAAGPLPQLTSSIAPVPAGMQRYATPTYRFSLDYPEDLQVHDTREEGGAHTIAFEDASGEKGFQVYIQPYVATHITLSRIQEDTRNTYEGSSTQITIGGVPALIFYSDSPLLGRLREVWFINYGYLYEVTTFADDDAWLSQIMATWRFQ